MARLIVAILCAYAICAAAEEAQTVVKVGVIDAPPFVMIHRDREGEFEGAHGYLIDIWNAIASKENWSTDWYEVADGRYGTKTDGVWNGLLGDVASEKIDVAVAPMTIVPKRLDDFAFTRPLMPAGLIAMARRPNAGEPQPFSDLADIFTSFDDPRIGVIRGGSTWTFFTERTSHPLYRAIGKSLSKLGESEMLDNSTDGVDRLRNGDLDVIFLEQFMADFLAWKKPCDIIGYGRPIGRHEYGMTLRKGSPLLQKINRHIIELQVDGDEAKIRNKWWQRQCVAPKWCACGGNDISSEEQSGEDLRERPAHRKLLKTCLDSSESAATEN